MGNDSIELSWARAMAALPTTNDALWDLTRSCKSGRFDKSEVLPNIRTA